MAAGSSGRLKEKTNLSDCWGGDSAWRRKNKLAQDWRQPGHSRRADFVPANCCGAPGGGNRLTTACSGDPDGGRTGKTKSTVKNCRACWRRPLLGDWKKPQQDALRERPLSGPTRVFPDVDISHHVCTAVNWATAAGIGIERWSECARAGKRSRTYHARQQRAWQLREKLVAANGQTAILHWDESKDRRVAKRVAHTKPGSKKTSFARTFAVLHWGRHQRSGAVPFSVEWTTCFCDLLGFVRHELRQPPFLERHWIQFAQRLCQFFLRRSVWLNWTICLASRRKLEAWLRNLGKWLRPSETCRGKAWDITCRWKPSMCGAKWQPELGLGWSVVSSASLNFLETASNEESECGRHKKGVDSVCPWTFFCCLEETALFVGFALSDGGYAWTSVTSHRWPFHFDGDCRITNGVRLISRWISSGSASRLQEISRYF